ncbi:hypothetical protein WN943_023333 [Citrus x changshan-huyou]
MAQGYIEQKGNIEMEMTEVDGDENPLSLTNSCQEKLCHLTLMLGLPTKFSVSIFDAKKLRSLSLFYDSKGQSAASPVLQGLFDQLTCLRALKIEELWYGDQTIEIPKGLENLIHLRYLKLSTDYLAYVANGFERLTSLRTLSGFTVARMLMRLKINAHLEKKKNLVHLTLDFDKGEDEDEDEDYAEAPNLMNEENEAKQEAICEALEAPRNIVIRNNPL